MPMRDPMTPHPLSVIVARGTEESFTAVGTDPHSKSLTVIATGNTPIDRILEEVAKAAAQQMDAARGTVEVVVPETEPGKGPTKSLKKGPVAAKCGACICAARRVWEHSDGVRTSRGAEDCGSECREIVGKWEVSDAQVLQQQCSADERWSESCVRW